jgi:hypothetical protein
MVVFGFYQWYFKIQRFQDMKIRYEAEQYLMNSNVEQSKNPKPKKEKIVIDKSKL